MLTQFTTRAGSLFTPAKSHSEFNPWRNVTQHADVPSTYKAALIATDMQPKALTIEVH